MCAKSVFLIHRGFVRLSHKGSTDVSSWKTTELESFGWKTTELESSGWKTTELESSEIEI